ncbi:ATP-dependent zinc metalloprotease FtsH [Candidatus Mcinerneyibacteriota bacterium]|nr:ATP-dependent zinc metalloprotease FtsH [Candidatus Mcinerneyibacteriota bacterium]
MGKFKDVMIWIILFFIFMLAFSWLNKWQKNTKTVEITYSEFIAQVESGNVDSVEIQEMDVTGLFKKPYPDKATEFTTVIPLDQANTIDRLLSQNSDIKIKKPSSGDLKLFLIYVLPTLIFVVFFIMFLRNMQGGNNKAFSFGKSRARMIAKGEVGVTFNDVAGCEEAKEELEEIIDYLKAPSRFQRLGGKIPKGVLLVGAPGTGKTLLAKAVAGEANVPFLSLSGSDFVEMFVGVGAARVRDLFEQAKRGAPAIIFIDEIDAVGRSRGSGLGGGHDEREQTLNQLLVEMDGFDTKLGVILIAATNRPDVLDPALLRPGRFDRQVVIDLPDVKGREEILKVHTRSIPVHADVRLDILAKATPGMSGADLANMTNEAALLAARLNKESVEMEDFEEAKDKVLMGKARKSLVITDEEKKRIAYHESGHVLIGKLTKNGDPIHKVTIVPRGRALGVTHFLPLDQKHLYTKDYLTGLMQRILGGRAAEEIIFNEYSSGASDDLERVTDIARKMVSNWGMSDEVGPLTFGKKEEHIFLGRDLGSTRDYSESTAEKIDRSVSNIVTEAYREAKTILAENKDILVRLAEALLDKEVLEAEEIDTLIRGEGANG